MRLARRHVDVGLVETRRRSAVAVAHDGDGVALARALGADSSSSWPTPAWARSTPCGRPSTASPTLPVVVHLNRFDADDPLHVANLRWLTDVDGLRVVVDAAAALDALLGN